MKENYCEVLMQPELRGRALLTLTASLDVARQPVLTDAQRLQGISRGISPDVLSGKDSLIRETVNSPTRVCFE